MLCTYGQRCCHCSWPLHFHLYVQRVGKWGRHAAKIFPMQLPPACFHPQSMCNCLRGACIYLARVWGHNGHPSALRFAGIAIVSNSLYIILLLAHEAALARPCCTNCFHNAPMHCAMPPPCLAHVFYLQLLVVMLWRLRVLGGIVSVLTFF
jgi:hypothetical protein